jgi:hypothetical protein
MLDIELKTILGGYDRKSCWVHPRAGIIPVQGAHPIVVMMMYKLRLTGMDVFYATNDMRTDDGGETWTGPTEHADTLGRRPAEGGIEEGVCDWWPVWHQASGCLLGTGHTVRYLNDTIPSRPEPRSTVYTIYDPQLRTFTPWKKLITSAPDKFIMEGAGSTQRLDLPGGDILLPTYFTIPETYAAAEDGMPLSQYVATVMRCTFDGKTLSYVEHGNELTVPTGRGLVEPALTAFGGRYFLSLRNNDSGFVTSSADGLHFDPVRPWTFDDGSNLGNYNTQQHWLTTSDKLYLVYTRRGANNDHVFRHRAPLFIAQVDPKRLCVGRETEQILVPERGARLGNFGITKISDNETWVTVSEWMQTTEPDPYDFAQCEKYGSDNSIFLAKIRW